MDKAKCFEIKQRKIEIGDLALSTIIGILNGDWDDILMRDGIYTAEEKCEYVAAKLQNFLKQ